LIALTAVVGTARASVGSDDVRPGAAKERTMGIFSAMITAVSGLRAQSFALDNISGNIANSGTVGFKRNDTTFEDLVADTGTSQAQRSGSVQALTRSTNSVQGGIESSDIGTNMSINGDGYFILGQKVSDSGGNVVFSGQNLYTRRGDFALDKNGYLVNGAGYYLKALPVDATTGNPSSNTPVPIQFTNDFLPAKATQSVTYRANLPQFPLTANADPDVPGSDLIPATLTISPGVSGTDQATFLDNSVSGGAVTTYDPSGNPVNVQFRWGKTSDTPATWNLFYLSNSAATGTQTAWTNAGTNYTFDAAGKMTPPVASTTLNGVTVNGTTVGNVTMQFGGTGLTQYADTNGTVQVNALSQDGYSAGQVIGVTVNDGGHIVANYSNGQTLEVGRVVLAGFNGEDWLQKLDGGAFAETLDSGPPILGATGKISGSSNEASNTDIATEFSKLIVTQQAYSANTRIVSTGDQMMQETLNMKR
jgi:flagellar hook protein FlgE